jgi:hypothetical protein
MHEALITGLVNVGWTPERAERRVILKDQQDRPQPTGAPQHRKGEIRRFLKTPNRKGWR